MIMKKMTIGIIGFCFASALLFPYSIAAKDTESNQATTITTSVPTTQQAQLTIEGKGSISVDGKPFTETQGIVVGRLKSIKYTFLPAKGYVLGKVMYDHVNVTDKVLNNTYMANPVYKDGTSIEVTFIKESSEGQQLKNVQLSQTGTKPLSKSDKGVNTGDYTTLAIWIVLAIFSISAGIVVIKKKQER